MKQIRVSFAPDAPESYKTKTIKAITALGWVQNSKKVDLIPACDDSDPHRRTITVFFDWPQDTDAVYPVGIDFAILP